MSLRLYVLDVPENEAMIAETQRQEGIASTRIGPYYVLSSAGPALKIDRRSTGARHAVWYSWVAGLDGWRIEQWNGDALTLVAR